MKSETPDGVLAGRTLLRFAHAFDASGGTETYLADLDRALLDRLPLTIIRVHLTHGSCAERSDHHFGNGRLVRVALPISLTGMHGARPPRRSRLAEFVRDHVLYHRIFWQAYGRKWALLRTLPTRDGEAIGAGEAIRQSLEEFQIDLVIVHSLGGRDSDAVIREARSAGVPVCLVNHYSNARFRHLSVRRHVMMADAAAGVTGLQVPGYLRGGFTTLSDGVDLVFFNRNSARPTTNPAHTPIILLPARIVREKGHLDLVRAAASLRSSGYPCTIAFAGRQCVGTFFDELSAEIRRVGLTESVRFLGPLTSEQLRDWYGSAAVVALPTFHDEGLPRALLEAGAMTVPVVAYATAGVVDAILQRKTGFLVPTGDVRQLEAKLRELLEDESLRVAMGINGRRYVESRFGLQHLADRHLQFYSSVITRACRCPQRAPVT